MSSREQFKLFTEVMRKYSFPVSTLDFYEFFCIEKNCAHADNCWTFNQINIKIYFLCVILKQIFIFQCQYKIYKKLNFKFGKLIGIC